MNADHDPQVIARVRAALDEVAATPAVVVADPTHPGWSGRRWLAIAASVVLVGGAVTAIAVNLSNRHSVSPAASDTTAPTTAPTVESTMPYFLAAADLAPGPVEQMPIDTSATSTVTVWTRDGDPANGLLIATNTVWLGPDHADPPVSPDSEYIEVGGASLLVESFGITAEERSQLAAQIVPGSGLPWVLPVEGWEWLGMSSDADQRVARSQLYGVPPTVAFLSTGLGVGVLGRLIRPLGNLAPTTDVAPVAVAGRPGWRATIDEGERVVVIWKGPNGDWASLEVSAALADRVDGLIAAIVPTGQEGTTASTVPTPDPWVGEVSLEMAVSSYALAPYDPNTFDPAVGQPIPTIRLTDGEFTVDAPTLFVFVAHWCPHCNSGIPVLQQAVTDGTLGGARVVVVLTGADLDRAQQAAWLAGLGWTGDVLYDTSSGDRSPGVMAGYFGVPGYPSFVMVDADGMVAGRVVGETAVADLATLTRIDAATEQAGATAVGRLVIAAIDVDWFVVGDTSGLDQAARLGPVLVGSVSPTTLRAQAGTDPVTVTVVGNRTTFGHPFYQLDELQPGDRIEWSDQYGAATFEVVATTTCTGDAVTDCPPASAQDQLVLITQDPVFTNQGWLVVTAHRVP